MLHAIPSLAITFVLSTLMSRLYSRLGRSRRSSNSVLPLKWQTGWYHQRSEGSWPFALQFVVHLEIHRGSPSSPSPLRHWGVCLTKIWPREARCRACLTSFCHSISIYTGIYCHLCRDIVIYKLKTHYNWQSKCGDIYVWRRFFHSEIRATRWLLWHSDFTRFNFGRGCAPFPTGGAYDAPQTP